MISSDYGMWFRKESAGSQRYISLKMNDVRLHGRRIGFKERYPAKGMKKGRKVMMKVKKLLWMMSAILFCFGLGAVVSEGAASADTYFKPIRGIRRTCKNVEKIQEKREIKKQARKAEEKMNSFQVELSDLQRELAAYEELQARTEYSGTVFADNGRSTEVFRNVAQFDSYFKKIENYGNVNENLLNSEYMNPSNDENDSLYFATLVSEQVSPVAFLESKNTDAVDISNYLSYRIYKKKQHIEKVEKRLKRATKKADSLKQEAKKIITKDIVFNAENVTEVSNISVAKMRELLRGTKLEQFADVYVKIEKAYGINAIALCALSAYESAWGESRRALVDHNYTGFGVYSDSSRGINATSGEQNLWMTAKFLANNYLKQGQNYYHGVGLDGLNRSYSTAGTWAYDIEYIATQLMNAI